jgi:propanediol dehydratase small subunit
MKSLLIAAALVFAPVVAQAQVAAGALPNTFDRPATAAPVPAAALDTASAPENALSEQTLRTIIAGARAGTLDYALMTNDLAGKVREQEAAITPLLESFGALQTIEFVGRQDGADLFAVAFEKAATQWLIGFNEDGKVAALLFRPAQ